MADFAHIDSPRYPDRWVNLDYVKWVVAGLDRDEDYLIVFSDGETLQLPHSDGARLVAQLNLCCLPATASRTNHVRTINPKAYTPEPQSQPARRRSRAATKSTKIRAGTR